MLATSVSFLLYSNGFIHALCILFLILLSAAWIFFSTRPADTDEKISLPLEIFNTLLPLSFGGFPSAPKVIRREYLRGQKGRSFLFALLGLVIAVPLFAVVLSLLIRADASFEALWEQLNRTVISEGLLYFWQIILGLPVAFYLYSLLFGSAGHRRTGCVSYESAAQAGGRMRAGPPALIYAVLTPLLAIYLVFFISQGVYLFSAFFGTLPAGNSYAEYARRGFFELCTLCGINLFLILLAYLFTRRTEKAYSLRVYLSLLCLVSLLLTAISLSKMALYIEYYGLTPLRVYTSWFMVLLALVFLFIICKQIFPRLPAATCILVSSAAMLLLLFFSGTDGLIARYNIDRYRAGSLPEVDIPALYALSDGAVPYVAGLVDDRDPAVAEQARNYLLFWEGRLSSDDWRGLNRSTLRAQQAIGEALYP